MMPENFPNLKKEKDIQVQEAQKVPNRINPKRPTPRHIIIKMAEFRILKAARKKVIKKKPIKLSTDFSAETLQARRKWHDIFKVLKEKNLQTRILYPARLTFRTE